MRDPSFRETALPVGRSFFMNAFNLVHSPSCVMYGIVVEAKKERDIFVSFQTQ